MAQTGLDGRTQMARTGLPQPDPGCPGLRKIIRIVAWGGICRPVWGVWPHVPGEIRRRRRASEDAFPGCRSGRRDSLQVCTFCNTASDLR
jgi:hypothetical protein